MVIITLFSLFSFPGEDMGFINIPYLDKIAHFTFHCIILVLGTLFRRERRPNHFVKNKAILGMFLFSVAYGIVIETLQFTMPFGRAAEIWDILANLSGALFGVLLIKKYLSLIEK